MVLHRRSPGCIIFFLLPILCEQTPRKESFSGLTNIWQNFLIPSIISWNKQWKGGCQSNHCFFNESREIEADATGWGVSKYRGNPTTTTTYAAAYTWLPTKESSARTLTGAWGWKEFWAKEYCWPRDANGKKIHDRAIFIKQWQVRYVALEVLWNNLNSK